MTAGERDEAEQMDRILRHRRRLWLARRAAERALVCGLHDLPRELVCNPSPDGVGCDRRVRRCPRCVGIVRWRVPVAPPRNRRLRYGTDWDEDDPGFEDAVRALEGG